MNMAYKYTKTYVSIDRNELVNRLSDMAMIICFEKGVEKGKKVDIDRIPKWITFDLEDKTPTP